MNNMDKLIALVSSWAIATATAIFGQIDLLPQCLLWFMLFDMISGLMKAIYNKKLDSDIMWRGMLRKGAILLVIAVSHRLDITLDMTNMMIRNTACMFYITMEGLSLVENVGEIVTLPKFIVDLLQKLHDQSNEGGE